MASQSKAHLAFGLKGLAAAGIDWCITDITKTSSSYSFLYTGHYMCVIDDARVGYWASLKQCYYYFFRLLMDGWGESKLR